MPRPATRGHRSKTPMMTTMPATTTPARSALDRRSSSVLTRFSTSYRWASSPPSDTSWTRTTRSSSRWMSGWAKRKTRNSTTAQMTSARPCCSSQVTIAGRYHDAAPSSGGPAAARTGPPGGHSSRARRRRVEWMTSTGTAQSPTWYGSSDGHGRKMSWRMSWMPPLMSPADVVRVVRLHRGRPARGTGRGSGPGTQERSAPPGLRCRSVMSTVDPAGTWQ